MQYLLWIIVVVTILLQYFYKNTMLKKQKKAFELENAKRETYLKSLKVEDEVVTVYGMYGTIKNIEGDIIMLEIATKCIIKVELQSLLIKTN